MTVWSGDTEIDRFIYC